MLREKTDGGECNKTPLHVFEDLEMTPLHVFEGLGTMPLHMKRLFGGVLSPRQIV